MLIEARPEPAATTGEVDDRDLARDARAGCLRSRNTLVEGNLPFVVHLAREYRGMGVPMEDLVHEGVLGLFEAARRFDPDRGTKFITFASWWIRKCLRTAVRKSSAVVTVPGHHSRRMREIREAESELRARLGRRPDDDEISERLGASVEWLRRTRSRHRREVRLDRPVGERGDETLANLIPARVDGGPETDLLRAEVTGRLCVELDRLTDREREVLEWRFGLDGEPVRSLEEVSQRIGLSRERVRQIEVRAKTRLRRRLRIARLAPLA